MAVEHTGLETARKNGQIPYNPRGIDQLRPHKHQRIPRPQHHQVLPHFRTPVLDREQRLRIDSPQPRQLVGIEPVILALATLRPLHQPRIGHQNLVPATHYHFPHPGRVRPHFEDHARGR